MPRLNFRRYGAAFRIFILRYLLAFVDRRGFEIFSTIFLVVTFTLRLLFSTIFFVYTRRSLYLDVYLFNFLGLLRDFVSIVRWSRLGDFFESLRILGPSRAIRFLSRPAARLAQLESTWYWKSNPAMWLPDKMWNDIVDSFDRRYLSRAKWIVKTVKREIENFADHPYARLPAYFWYIVGKLSKLRFPRFRWPRFFGQFFVDIRSRFFAIIASRSMLVYHGLGKNAVIYGKVPAFFLSPLTFDFDKKRIVFKEAFRNSGPTNSDKLINDEILSKLSEYIPDNSLFSKPTIPISNLTVQQLRYKQIIQFIKK